MRENNGEYMYFRPPTLWGISFAQAMSRVGKDDNGEFPQLILSEELLLPMIVEEIKNNKKILENPKRKVIFALELDCAEFANFFNKIQHFMNLVVNGEDILRDKKLGFPKTDYKALLLKKYLYYASKFNDREFESKLEQTKARLAAAGIALN